MTDQPAPSLPRPVLERIGRGFEYLLFNSRWLMAPFYAGLVVAIAVLFLKFLRMLWEFILHAPGAKSTETILDALALIDVTLVGNLILIVVFSGYENFVSRIDTSGNPNWPLWITKIDFAGLKQKLLASIVAISVNSCMDSRGRGSMISPGLTNIDIHLPIKSPGDSGAILSMNARMPPHCA